jgi:hypothetical protein
MIERERRGRSGRDDIDHPAILSVITASAVYGLRPLSPRSASTYAFMAGSLLST